MALTTRIKNGLNLALRPFNAKLEGLSSEHAEIRRLTAVQARGLFDRPAFDLPQSMRAMNPSPIFRALERHRDRISRLRAAGQNEVGFDIGNEYFPSPDAEVLYALIASEQPARIIEVGSGNSTRVARQAALDLGLDVHITAIDPSPRVDVHSLVDQLIAAPVEETSVELAAALRRGDLLLIDSSHEVRTANDVVFLYLNVLPRLCPGVLVHVHDIFLPYDYPAEYVLHNRWPWNEQYVLQAILAFGDAFEVLWAGHYLQRTAPDFDRHFPLKTDGLASSVVLRRR